MRYHLIDLAALGPPLLVLIGRAAPGSPAGSDCRRRRAGRSTRRGSWRFSISLSPHIVLGSDLTPRLRPLLVFALLCYSGVALSPRGPAPGGAAGPGLGLGRRRPSWPETSAASAARWTTSRRGFPSCVRGSRVYPVIFDPRSPSILVKPFLHAWGYYGLARDVVTPYAFAWHADAVSLPLPRAASASARLGLSLGRRGRALRARRGAPLHRRAALLGVALLRRGSRPRRGQNPGARDVATTICSPGRHPPTSER